MHNPFRYFNSSPEVIRLVVMMYIRYPLSLRQVEDILFERGIDICHETIRFWWNRFGPARTPKLLISDFSERRSPPRQPRHLFELHQAASNSIHLSISLTVTHT
jgi:putative transposase